MSVVKDQKVYTGIDTIFFLHDPTNETKNYKGYD